MDLYSNVIPLTGSFHKLPVFQRILFNRVMAVWAFKIGLLILEQRLLERLINVSKEAITLA